MSGEVVVVANPTAGRGRAARLIDPTLTALRSAGLDARVLAGGSAAETVQLVKAAVADDAAAVVALGGDGLVHWAVQGVAGTPVPLAIMPGGTGNDMAQVLQMPGDPDALAASIVARHTRRIDAGLVESEGRWFIGVLCAGFDSAVNERANKMRWPQGPRRYDLAIAMETVRLRARAMVLTLDGERDDLPVTLVAVGNGPQYGGGKRIVPDARLDDGMFDVAVIEPVTRRTLARLAPRLPVGGHVGHPAVRIVRATTVRLESTGVLAYADGERIGPLPVEIRCVPGALTVVQTSG